MRPHHPAVTGAAFLAALRAALPDVRLLTDRADTASYRFDETEYTHPGWPLGVALAASTAEVATIVRLAAQHRTPIVPRGAGTGLSRGAVVRRGGRTPLRLRPGRRLEI